MISNILKSREVFQKLSVLEESVFPLDRAALALGIEECPEMDIDSYLGRLDTLAARVEVVIGRDRSAANVIEGLNEVLFIQEALRGNNEDYYDPRNSFINEVLERKSGIPISLSVIYMEVARRIDFPIRGIGFPGHFFVAYLEQERQIYLDPFNFGRTLTMDDCQELLDRVYGGSVSVQPSFLQPMDKRAIISRMLFNLKGIYYQKEDYHKALSVVDRILMFNPGIQSEIRDRGLLYMQTSLFAKALADLENYLSAAATPEDESYIKSHITMLRGVVAVPN